MKLSNITSNYNNYLKFKFIDRLKFIFYGTNLYIFIAIRYQRWRYKRLGYPNHPTSRNYYKFFGI